MAGAKGVTISSLKGQTPDNPKTYHSGPLKMGLTTKKPTLNF